MSSEIVENDCKMDVHHQEELEKTDNPTENIGDVVTYTKAEERKLLLLLDLILIGFSMMLYISAYLDRGNLGNARLQGLERDALNNSDSNYSLALALFYVTYIVFAIPGTLASRYWLPSTAIGVGAGIWALAATCMAATSSPGGVYVCRLLIGLGEAMFGQAVALTNSYWYTKQELSKRIGVFIAAGSLAGAFGGLIAFGVNSIKNSPIAQWRVLFLIEGLPGLVLAAAVYFFMPTHPRSYRWFGQRLREIAMARKAKESGEEDHTEMDWKAVKHSFRDWKTYVIALMYMSMNVNLSSIGGFLPTIVKGLGYTNAQAQLFTVPPYAVALAVTIIVSAISDRLRSRGIPLALTYTLGVIGWVILLVTDAATKHEGTLRLRYFGVICVVAPAYASIPLQLAWVSNNNPAQSQRAVGLGMLNTIGQTGSILGSYSFPSSEGLQYRRGVAVNIGFQCFGALVAFAMSMYYRHENRRRNQIEGVPSDNGHVDVKNGYDKAPGFRYTP